MAQAMPDGQLWCQMALTMMSLLVCTMSAACHHRWSVKVHVHSPRVTTRKVHTKSVLRMMTLRVCTKPWPGPARAEKLECQKMQTVLSTTCPCSLLHFLWTELERHWTLH